MKRIGCAVLSFLIFFTMAACHSGESNTVTFYYCRDPQQYQYFEEDGVIRGEERELLGHRNDLQYLLGLYLAGPMEEGLKIPFTKTTRLISVKQEQETILIELSDNSQTLTDSEFSLACACLTLTCMNYTPCQSVVVLSGSRTITMNADNILLFDSLPQQETTGG